MWQHQLGLLKKWTMIVIGALVVLLGLVTFWLPLPVGLPLLLIGVPVLIRYSPHARRWWTRLRRGPLRRLPLPRHSDGDDRSGDGRR
jgi:hypothetical protein